MHQYHSDRGLGGGGGGGGAQFQLPDVFWKTRRQTKTAISQINNFIFPNVISITTRQIVKVDRKGGLICGGAYRQGELIGG